MPRRARALVRIPATLKMLNPTRKRKTITPWGALRKNLCRFAPLMTQKPNDTPLES